MQQAMKDLGKHMFVHEGPIPSVHDLPPAPLTGDVMINNQDSMALNISADTREPTMYIYHGGNDMYSFAEMRAQMIYALRRANTINRGRWQTLDVSQSDLHATHELRNVHIVYDVPHSRSELADDVSPDMPWAELHFEERVGYEPLNPAPSYKYWPHHNGDKDRHVDGTVFSHTYPERFWPKHAGDDPPDPRNFANRGIRFNYGDLDGVVDQLVSNPLTRQAVLPVWFPEDTGATDRRVPCSLTYHFMGDGQGNLDCWYSMRACDFLRHFHNDLYLAARLLQWVCSVVAAHGVEFEPGRLNMAISSLHLFKGDVEKLS
jgi:hypothetical protein